MATGYEKVYDALSAQGLLVPSWSEGEQAHCPGPIHHRGDQSASLSLKEAEDGKALLYCHAGCAIEEVMKALGLPMNAAFNDPDEVPEDGKVVAEYIYTDEQDEPLIRVARIEPGPDGKRKTFTQERWEDGRWQYGLKDTRRVLFNLPSVATAVATGQTVYIVEGEKDCIALTSVGVVATTSIGGAGRNKWKDEYSEFLRGADVVVVPDADEAGREHGARVVESLRGYARSVRIALVGSGKDISDHFDAGLGLSDLKDEDFVAELGGLNWDDYQVQDTDWLYEPYLPVAGRVLLVGKTGSLKSLWAMWIACKLASIGKKVAYFSVEMRPSQSVARIKKLNPPKANFTLFTKLKLEDDRHLSLMMDSLKGYDLIVMDSWNAIIQNARYDQEVADLDNEVFQPLIDATGATILFIDNTGHDVITQDGGKVKMNRARGSSAKADKMDLVLWMERPNEDDNYTTNLHVTKMRYDHILPSVERLSTPPNDIEFYITTEKGLRMGPAWTEVLAGEQGSTVPVADSVTPQDTAEPEAPATDNGAAPSQDVGEGGSAPGLESQSNVAENAPSPAPTEPPTAGDMTLQEQLALARLQDTFRGVKMDDTQAVDG